jgi:ribosomal protein S27AE
MLPDQSPIAFIVILVSLAAAGLVLAGRDLFTAARRRADRACPRCGEPYVPAAWPTRSVRRLDGGAFANVHVCPRCGEAWTSTNPS